MRALYWDNVEEKRERKGYRNAAFDTNVLYYAITILYDPYHAPFDMSSFFFPKAYTYATIGAHYTRRI